MLLRHTLLYLPAQIVGPLFQLIAVIVWINGGVAVCADGRLACGARSGVVSCA